MTNVAAVAAGTDHSLALLGDGPPSLLLPLGNPRWQAGEFRFEFVPRRDSVYAVEFTDSPDPLQWTASALARGDGSVRTWTELPRSNQRFYRVRHW